jgi:hypothetical protein
MPSIRKGRASAALNIGNIGLFVVPLSAAGVSLRFFSRHVAHGQALRSFPTDHGVTFPSLHVITIPASPSRSILIGTTSVAVDFAVDRLESEYSFMCLLVLTYGVKLAVHVRRQ